MTSVNTILVVGSVDCNDRVSTRLMAYTLGKPGRSAAEYGGPGIDIAAVGSVDTSQLVESSFTVEVSATSVDAVTAIVASIAAEIRDLADITVGLKGSVYSGTLKVRIGECVEIPLGDPWLTLLTATGTTHTTRVEIIVRREPYVCAAAETPHDAAPFVFPGVVPMALQTGEYAAPWDMLFDFAALECKSLFAGRYPDPLAIIADFAYELGDATWVDVSGTGSAYNDAAGYGAAVSHNECWGTDGSCYTDLDVTDKQPGEYLVLVLCKTNDVADPGTIKHAYCEAVTITSATLKLYPLGVVALPCAAVRGSAASTLCLTLSGAGAGDAAFANAVFLIPVSFGGMVGWRRASGHAHEVRFEGEMVYADDVGALGEVFGGRRILGKGGVLVAVAEQVTPAPTTVAALTVTDVPRYEQFPIPEGLAQLVAASELEMVYPTDDDGYVLLGEGA